MDEEGTYKITSGFVIHCSSMVVHQPDKMCLFTAEITVNNTTKAEKNLSGKKTIVKRGQ
jgi:hypothetical protein